MAIQSYGDWRYPFIVLAWKLAAWLTPRRKVRAGNVVFTLPCTNWITHFRWHLFEKKEPEVRHFIDQYVRDGDVFFDIGANIGVFSIYAAKRHPNLRGYAFEPEFSNLSLLKENLIANHLIGRVSVYGLAVGDKNGLSRLHVQDLTPGAACHTENQASIDTTEEGYRVQWAEGVSVITLDTLCQDLQVVPNAIKIDTDGNEEKILKGAVDTLRNGCVKSLVIEMPPDVAKSDACRHLLQAAGFSLVRTDFRNTRNEIWTKHPSR